MKLSRKLFAVIISILLAFPAVWQGVLADTMMQTVSDDLKVAKSCVAPNEVSDFDWYYDSSNIYVNPDAKELTLGFDASYQAVSDCTSDNTYLIFKAPQGYMFSDCSAESILSFSQSELRFYAYTDSEMSKEYYVPSKRQSAGVAPMAWAYNEWSVGNLPKNTLYIKILLPEGKAWGRHINNINLDVVPNSYSIYPETYKNEFVGSMFDDKYVVEYGNSYYADWGRGEGHMWGGDSTGRYAIFSVSPDTKVKCIEFEMYSVHKNGTAKVSVCDTLKGEYIHIPCNFTSASVGDAWYSYTYSADRLPPNSKYIKIAMEDVNSNSSWSHYLDSITLTHVNDNVQIDEMPSSEYGPLNLKRPNRPNDENGSLEFVDYLGEVVYMAPEGKKISSISFNADSVPTVLATDVYESGEFKTATVTKKSDNSYECTYLPFDTQYIKVTNAEPTNVKMTFVDLGEPISASETVVNRKLSSLLSNEYVVDYKQINVDSFTTTVEQFSDINGSVTSSGESDGSNSYVVFAAPDNSVITDFCFFTRDSARAGMNVLCSDKQNGVYTQVSVSKTWLTGSYYKFTLKNFTGARYIKLCFGKLSETDKANNKFIGYEFTWKGTPCNGAYGDRYYSVNIDNADTRQEITGWGVFPYVGSRAEYDEDDKLNKAVFSDLGATTIRLELYADYDLSTDTLVESTLDSLIKLINSTKDSGREYMLSVWTPPASMKSNGLKTGYNADLSSASLLERYESKFASYLSASLKYIQNKTNTLPVALSIQNEPESPNQYQSCVYTDEQYSRVFNLVADKLEAEGLDCIRLIGSEASTFKKIVARWFGVQWENIPSRMNVLCYHGYYPDNYTTEYPLLFDRLNGRELWQTEFCNTETTLSDKEYIANTVASINHNTQFYRSNRWFWWCSYADTDINKLQSLIYTGEDGNKHINSRYRLLNRIYKSVIPGSTVVGVNTDDYHLSNVLNTTESLSDVGAFKTKNGNVATIVNNDVVHTTYSVTGMTGNSAVIYRYVGDEATEVIDFAEINDGCVNGIALDGGESAVIVSGNDMYVSSFVNRLDNTVNISINPKICHKFNDAVIIVATKKENSIKSATLTRLADTQEFDYEIPIAEDGLNTEIYIWDAVNLYPIYNLKL